MRFFLCFHTNCEIICSSSLKNTIGSLIGITLNLYIALGHILIFTIFILPIHEHGIFLHLFVSSLISFISVVYFSIYRSFVSLGRFIPKYFILFIAMVKGIVSLISLSVFSLFSSVQSLSCVRLFVTPWTAARQASLSITNSWSPPKPMSIESVMPFNHLIFYNPLLLLPSNFPSIGVFFQWVISSHQMAKVLEFQLQHQSFQWTPRTDLL